MSKAKKVTIYEWANWANKQLEGHQRKLQALNDSLTELERRLELIERLMKNLPEE